MLVRDAWPRLRFEGKPQCHIIPIAKESGEIAMSASYIFIRTHLNTLSCADICRPVSCGHCCIRDSRQRRRPQCTNDAGSDRCRPRSTFRRLEAEAAWTTNARTDFTHTITLPDHTCMLTGRPVLQPEGMADTVNHGLTLNDGGPRATLHTAGNPHIPYIASTFDAVHDAGLSTGLYVSKDKFVIFKQTYDETNGAPGPHGRDKIDSFFFQDDGAPTYSAGMNQRFLADMAAHHFNYAFVHYRDTDSAGHAFGWGSALICKRSRRLTATWPMSCILSKPIRS